jgi:hypothetical protein
MASSGSSTASSTSPTSPWSYVGCANDTSAHRALDSASMSSSSMTVKACQSYCLDKNYPLAGLEYSTQCCCGLLLGSYSTVGYTASRWPVPVTRPRPTAVPHASACTITPIACTPGRTGCGYIQSLRLLHRQLGRAWSVELHNSLLDEHDNRELRFQLPDKGLQQGGRRIRFGMLLRQHYRGNEQAAGHFGLHGDVLHRKFDGVLCWLKTTPGVLRVLNKPRRTPMRCMHMGAARL